jgi:hypothetical protein
MVRGRLLPLLIVTVVSAKGCSGFFNPYACIYETRFVGTAGTATTPNGTVVVEHLNFRDYTPEAQSPTELIWSVRGQDFGALVVSVTLRDTRNPAQVVRPLVSFTQPSPGPFALRDARQIPPGERDQIFNLLSGNAMAVAELTNGSTITVPLPVTERQDWHRPNCG